MDARSLIDDNKKYDAIDWQSFSQKKNIEEIARNTKQKTEIQMTALAEVSLVLISISFEHFTCANIDWVWLGIIIVAAIPILILFGSYIIYIRDKRKIGRDIPNRKEAIDLFDNETCYYVLMAEAYSRKLNEAVDEEINMFYYIEMCFYLNKAIYNLSTMQSSVDKIFSKDTEKLYQKKMISVTRLNNLFKIIDKIYDVVAEKREMISSIDLENNYSKLNEEYEKSYRSFKRVINLQIIDKIGA